MRDQKMKPTAVKLGIVVAICGMIARGQSAEIVDLREMADVTGGQSTCECAMFDMCTDSGTEFDCNPISEGGEPCAKRLDGPSEKFTCVQAVQGKCSIASEQHCTRYDVGTCVLDFAPTPWNLGYGHCDYQGPEEYGISNTLEAGSNACAGQ